MEIEELEVRDERKIILGGIKINNNIQDIKMRKMILGDRGELNNRLNNLSKSSRKQNRDLQNNEKMHNRKGLKPINSARPSIRDIYTVSTKDNSRNQSKQLRKQSSCPTLPFNTFNRKNDGQKNGEYLNRNNELEGRINTYGDKEMSEILEENYLNSSKMELDEDEIRKNNVDMHFDEDKMENSKYGNTVHVMDIAADEDKDKIEDDDDDSNSKITKISHSTTSHLNVEILQESSHFIPDYNTSRNNSNQGNQLLNNFTASPLPQKSSRNQVEYNENNSEFDQTTFDHNFYSEEEEEEEEEEAKVKK